MSIAIKTNEKHPTQAKNQADAFSLLSIVGIAVLVAIVVSISSWISEDAFITLRYVENTISGHGAVFNVGEYVMGYTHPLWFLLLVFASLFTRNLILTAILLGIILTLLLVCVFGRYLLRQAGNPLLALAVLFFSACVLISSDIWVSFQTGGLENPLAHILLLLVVSETYFHSCDRPPLLLLWLSLLCLTRPDYVVFALPLGLVLMPRLTSISTFARSLVAVSPALVWLLFASLYYGSPFPNTGAAKLGAYPNLLYAIMQGLHYLADWCIGDPLAASATIVCLVFCGYTCRRNRAILAVLAGSVCYSIWILCIGGDFMRGRMVMLVFTTCVIVGSYCAVERLKNNPWPLLSCSLVLLWIFLLAIFQCTGNAFNWNTDPRFGALNERRFYPGYSLRSYLREGRLINPYLNLYFAGELREYAKKCGPITVHNRNPGTIGYLAGPKVTVIDTLGLTDRYVANLPKRHQVERIPRPGHVDKYIPISYLASRGDVALLPQWTNRILQRDCTLTSSVKPLMSSSNYLGPKGIVAIDLPPQ